MLGVGGDRDGANQHQPTLDMQCARTGGLRHRRQSPRAPTSSRGDRGRLACLSLARRARGRNVRPRRLARHLAREAGQPRRGRSAAGAQAGCKPQPVARSLEARSPVADASRSAAAHARRARRAARGSDTARSSGGSEAAGVDSAGVESCAARAQQPVNPAGRERGWTRKGSQAPPGQVRQTQPPPPPGSQGQHRGQTQTTAKPPPPGQAKKTPPPPPPPEG